MTSDDICAAVPGALNQQVLHLWRRQCTEWPRLGEGLAALKRSVTRSFDVGGSRVLAQWNPARVVSTGAKIDAASLAARPCFLCAANRPPEQRGIMYREAWLILCNPAPIFDPHFTIVSTAHEPQRIVPYLEPLLSLARDLNGRYTVFYNGPLCGASAPDHMHFQAAPAGGTPFETELAAQLCADRNQNGQRWIEWIRRDAVRVGVTRPSRRPMVLVVGAEIDRVEHTLHEVVDAFGAVHPAEPEPMLNLFATWAEDRWLAWVYPRRAHRPTIYGHGPDEYLISPGAVDLAGLLITPRQSDFERIGAPIIERVYEQVLLSPSKFAQIRERLTAS
ncbi:MAG: DUF4922 domain-containing protein [Phycisphaerae bacterium]|nr:DUF4922 domain-containing protein [Phycisphaerae bacterium]